MENKEAESHYEIQPDGLSMIMTYTVADPVYYTEPRTMTENLLKRPDAEFAPQPDCDPEVSSMHLNVE